MTDAHRRRRTVFHRAGDGRIVPPREGFPATIDGEPVTIPLAGLAVEKGQRIRLGTQAGLNRDKEELKFHFEPQAL
jgi:hypothetical protein